LQYFGHGEGESAPHKNFSNISDMVKMEYKKLPHQGTPGKI